MPVKIIDNTKKITLSTKVKGNIFLRLMTDEVVKISTPKTPKVIGDLRRNIVKSVLGLNSVIKWAQKYAAYQEKGVRRDGTHRVKNYTTPGTGAHFAENAIKKAEKQAGKVMKQAGLI